jgi:inosine-uridine nucleoside N-ribohydrolase
MGGAIDVRGNLRDGNPGDGANDSAEWNIYCDPDAAAAVFDADISKLVVPLDATNDVPIDRSFVENFRSRDLTPLGTVIGDVLIAALPLIDTNMFFAWDPLAAVALLDPSIVECRDATLKVITEGQDVGQTKLVNWHAHGSLKVAMRADAARFSALFEKAFRVPETV